MIFYHQINIYPPYLKKCVEDWLERNRLRCKEYEIIESFPPPSAAYFLKVIVKVHGSFAHQTTKTYFESNLASCLYNLGKWTEVRVQFKEGFYPNQEELLQGAT